MWTSLGSPGACDNMQNFTGWRLDPIWTLWMWALQVSPACIPRYWHVRTGGLDGAELTKPSPLRPGLFPCSVLPSNSPASALTKDVAIAAFVPLTILPSNQFYIVMNKAWMLTWT